jgi:stage 0 sporulation regulatory protein
MTQLKEINPKIEELRTLMHQLMNEKEALTDPKLVVLSQKLDGLLNEYDKSLYKSK